jgi:hypothetical protein
MLIEIDEEKPGLAQMCSQAAPRGESRRASQVYACKHSAGAQRQLKFTLSFLRQATERNSRYSLERQLAQGDPQ